MLGILLCDVEVRIHRLDDKSDSMLHLFLGLHLISRREGVPEPSLLLCKASLHDAFSGDHPYDGLRVIYSMCTLLTQTIRVCQALMQVADLDLRLASILVPQHSNATNSYEGWTSPKGVFNHAYYLS